MSAVWAMSGLWNPRPHTASYGLTQQTCVLLAVPHLWACGALILLHLPWRVFCSCLGCEARTCPWSALAQWLACFRDPSLWLTLRRQCLLAVPLLVATDHRGGYG
jgi:hypothetical protein